MRSHQLLLSFLGGSGLVKAARREAPDWEPWLPLLQGDRCFFFNRISRVSLEMIVDGMIRMMSMLYFVPSV